MVENAKKSTKYGTVMLKIAGQPVLTVIISFGLVKKFYIKGSFYIKGCDRACCFAIVG